MLPSGVTRWASLHIYTQRNIYTYEKHTYMSTYIHNKGLHNRIHTCNCILTHEVVHKYGTCTLTPDLVSTPFTVTQ